MTFQTKGSQSIKNPAVKKIHRHKFQPFGFSDLETVCPSQLAWKTNQLENLISIMTTIIGFIQSINCHDFP